jgi:hypothetical protein
VTDALIRALDERGFLTNGIFGRHTDLGVREVYESVLKESTKQRMKETGATRGGPWDAYDHIPTGRLRLQIDPRQFHFTDGLRHNWADGKTQRVENFLNDFICSLIQKAAVKRDGEIRRERQEQERIEREKRAREEAERLKRIQELRAERIRKKQQRRRELIDEAENWQKAKLIRRYIAAFEEKYGPTDRTRWALEEADRIDPLVDQID